MNEHKLTIPIEIPDRLRKFLIEICRMGSLGNISSAIMHDIGNALTVISGNSQLIQLKRGNIEFEEIHNKIDSILDQVTRVHNLIKRVGSFSGRSKENVNLLNPRSALDNVIFAIERKCSISDVEFVFTKGEFESAVKYDPSLLDYIFFESFVLFLQDFVKNGRLFVTEYLENGKWCVNAQFESDVFFNQLNDIWDPGDLDHRLIGVAVSLDEYGGSSTLFSDSNTLGWKIEIPVCEL